MIGTIAVAFGAINIVGGFMVTDRMLGMFSKKPKPKADAGDGRRAASLMILCRAQAGWRRRHRALHRRLLALHHRDQTGTHPTTAKQGNLIAAVGMAVAVVTTLLLDGMGNWGLIVVGLGVGSAVGFIASVRVQMTEMPQMVALYNGVGGGAVALIAWSEIRHGISPRRRRSRSTALIPILLRGGDRLGLLLGLEHRLRQAPGPDPDPAAGGARASR